MKKLIPIILIILIVHNDLICQPIVSRQIHMPQWGLGLPGYFQKKDKSFLFPNTNTYSHPVQTFISNYLFDQDSTDIFSIYYGQIGDLYNLLVNTVVETSDGGYLVGGGLDTVFNSPNINYDKILVKIDSNMHIQWSKIFLNAFAHTGQINSYVQLKDGYLLNGSIRVDSVGNILSERSGSILSNSFGTSDGNIITAGSQIISEVDSLLNGIWKKQYPNLNITSCVKTISNTYTFAGIADSAGNKAMFFLEIDTAGYPLKYKHTDFSNWKDSVKLIQTSDMGFVLLTLINGSVCLVHLDPMAELNHVITWPQHYYTEYRTPRTLYNLSDSVYTIVLDYHIMNYASLDPLFINANLHDSTACDFADSTIHWNGDTISFISQPITAANSLNDLIGNINLNITVGRRWAWYYCTVPTDIDPLQNNNTVSIYPNPTTSKITLSSAVLLNSADITIHNDVGIEVFKKHTENMTKEEISFNEISGIYILRLQAENINRYWKIVVVN